MNSRLLRAALAAAALCASGPALAAEPLTADDTSRELVYSAVQGLDWATTRDIRHHPGMFELNPILGRHPSDARVNAYMGGTLAAHWLVTYILPEKYRAIWQYVTIGIEGATVSRNLSLGLRIHF